LVTEQRREEAPVKPRPWRRRVVRGPVPAHCGVECHRRQVVPDLPLLAGRGAAAIQRAPPADARHLAQDAERDASQSGAWGPCHSHTRRRWRAPRSLRNIATWAIRAAADRSSSTMGSCASRPAIRTAPPDGSHQTGWH